MTKIEYDELMKLLEFPLQLASNYYEECEEEEYAEMQKDMDRTCALLDKIKVIG